MGEGFCSMSFLDITVVDVTTGTVTVLSRVSEGPVVPIHWCLWKLCIRGAL